MVITMKITKDMIVGEVLDIDTGAAKYFFEIGFCVLTNAIYNDKIVSVD